MKLGTIQYFIRGGLIEGGSINFLVQKGGLLERGDLIERGGLKREFTVT